MLNEADQLPDLLKGIERLTKPPDQVIFVDAGSVDESIELIHRWCEQKRAKGLVCSLVHKAGAYPGAARNVGVAATEAELVAFLDCGVIPDPGWLEALQRSITPDTPGVFGLCRSIPQNTGMANRICILSYGLKKQWPALPASLIRRKVFQQIGGFREDLRSAEDLEWVERYEARFGKRMICDQAFVYYANFPTNLMGAWRKWFAYARNTVRAGVQPWHQIYLIGIWTLIVLLAVIDPKTAVLVFGLYTVCRGVVLPAMRSGVSKIFRSPQNIPMLLTIGFIWIWRNWPAMRPSIYPVR